MNLNKMYGNVKGLRFMGEKLNSGPENQQI